MKILVYGFGPYKKWDDNITVDVLSLLEERDNLHRKVFDVEFNEDMFLDEIRSIAPDTIIGMGQHPRARKIRIERTSVNRKRNSRKEEPAPIHLGGLEKVYVRLKIPPGPDTRVTYDAGDYVCNFSMYVIGRYCADNGIKYAFLHVPMKIDPVFAAGIVDDMLDGLV